MRHVYRDPGGCTSTIDMIEIDEDTWLVSRILTKHSDRGVGAASRTLAAVCHDADLEDVILVLEVCADRDKHLGLTDTQLHDWYVRHGFTMKGVLFGVTVMERLPR